MAPVLCVYCSRRSLTIPPVMAFTPRQKNFLRDLYQAGKTVIPESAEYDSLVEQGLVEKLPPPKIGGNPFPPQFTYQLTTAGIEAAKF